MPDSLGKRRPRSGGGVNFTSDNLAARRGAAKTDASNAAAFAAESGFRRRLTRRGRFVRAAGENNDGQETKTPADFCLLSLAEKSCRRISGRRFAFRFSLALGGFRLYCFK